MKRTPLTQDEIDSLKLEFHGIDVEYVYDNHFEPWLVTIEDDPSANVYQKFRFYIRRKLLGYEQDEERITLQVPFNEKNAAKRLGADWDYVNRTWWVPKGTNLEPFREWLPENDPAETLPERVIELEAKVAATEAEIQGLKTSVAFLARQLDRMTTQ